jgi:eukaryotic-like serine/threonine-protein kinase
MDRNAYAAPAVDDDDTEPPGATNSHIRALLGGHPEPAVHAYGDVSTLDDAAGVSGERAALLSPGTCVAGKYVICDILGTGGSAVVYAAEQVNLRRVVAFKLHPARGALASVLLQRFEREAQLLARVHHENVVAVFDAGRMPDGSPYLVAQLVHGDSLATRLRSAGPLPVREAVDLARQVLHALIALGHAGITHRDVKPDNIVIDRLPDSRTVLKLVDFGIAKEADDEASRTVDQMVGTPGYMPPEQVRGEGIDARSDIYALGATLYEMLTGRPPHMGETVEEVAMATLFDSIAPPRALRPDCPEGLARIVMRALAKDPSERFASAREMESAFDRWQASQGPHTGLALAAAHDDIEDTLRLHMRSARRRRSHGRTRGLAALACLGMLSFLATLQVLQSPTAQLPAQVTALALQATELGHELAEHASAGVTDLLARARTSTLLSQANASAAELVTRVRSSVQHLLDACRRSAQTWDGVPDAGLQGSSSRGR